MQPRILKSQLTKRFYVATKYKELPDGNIEATEKHDVTDQILGVIQTETGFTNERYENLKERLAYFSECNLATS